MSARMTCSMISTVSAISAFSVCDHFQHLHDFSRRQAGHDFIEQKEPRPSRNGARDFEPLLAGQCQISGQMIAPRASPTISSRCVATLCGSLSVKPVHSETRGGGDVFLNRHVDERPSGLKSASDAATADLVRRKTDNRCSIEVDIARTRFQVAGDERKQGRLAGSVCPHDADHLTGIHGQIDAMQRSHAAENSFRDCGLPEDWSCRRVPVRRNSP